MSMTRILILMAVAGSLAACASPPSRFYTLAPIPPAEAKKTATAAGTNVAVRVDPVEIPDYLNRPQIVTREGANGAKVAEFDRWAGSLGDNFSSVVAENLALLLGSNRVLVDGGPYIGKADYTVATRVLRLDCVPSGYVLLKAQWRVISAGSMVQDTHLSTITEKVVDSQYSTIVAAVNRAVGNLSREIAAEILFADRLRGMPPAAGAATPTPEPKKEGAPIQ